MKNINQNHSCSSTLKGFSYNKKLINLKWGNISQCTLYVSSIHFVASSLSLPVWFCYTSNVFLWNILNCWAKKFKSNGATNCCINSIWVAQRFTRKNILTKSNKEFQAACAWFCFSLLYFLSVIFVGLTLNFWWVKRKENWFSLLSNK